MQERLSQEKILQHLVRIIPCKIAMILQSDDMFWYDVILLLDVLSEGLVEEMSFLRTVERQERAVKGRHLGG